MHVTQALEWVVATPGNGWYGHINLSSRMQDKDPGENVSMTNNVKKTGVFVFILIGFS